MSPAHREGDGLGCAYGKRGTSGSAHWAFSWGSMVAPGPSSLFPVAAILCLALCVLGFPSKVHSSETVTATPSPLAETMAGPPQRAEGTPVPALTPGQSHAAELLAYLLKVTLGMAGGRHYREDWRTRGLHEPLDYQNVVETMTSPNGNIHDVMVLDPNILDLSNVLYHYDKSLSLYEGEYGITSIYPASQYVAIRLLVLKKMHRKVAVNLSAILEREKLLCDPDLRPTQKDLRAMNLAANELTFLREIIQSKPRLLQYLKSPFLTKALWEAGVLKGDAFVEGQLSKANYSAYPCRRYVGSVRPNAFKVFFLPSMTDEFVHGQADDRDLSNSFRPTDFLRQMFGKLSGDIEAAAKQEMRSILLPGRDAQSEHANVRWDAIWNGLKEKYLSFYEADERPFAVYPENASQAIADICPKADFTVIILGRNVHKSILIDPKTDTYPAVNRIYVDIMDIKRARTKEDVQTLGRIVGEAIAERLLAE
jgi:hypothetical protein